MSRQIVSVVECWVGPNDKPTHKQTEGVEVETTDGSFWLVEWPVESPSHHDLGTEWHVYEAREGEDIDSATWLSRWPGWAAALSAICDEEEAPW